MNQNQLEQIRALCAVAIAAVEGVIAEDIPFASYPEMQSLQNALGSLRRIEEAAVEFKENPLKLLSFIRLSDIGP